MNFAGLRWTHQTASFVARSTMYHGKGGYQGKAGYYGVFRDAVAAAENWRKTMPAGDQAAVRTVVAASPLARFWPDLMAAD
jgi:hypothetical protein